MHKIIFLDHYGVLVLSKFNIERIHDSLPSIDELKASKPLEDFNHKCIDVLNSIIKETDVEIVVTSDWKNIVTLEIMQDFYISQGILKSPIAYTKSINNKSLTFQENRSIEVMKYVIDNKIKNWVCIDDLYLRLPNFVWCNFPADGLKNKKEEILSILNF